MTVTEITVFQLKKAYTNQELASDSAHKKALDYLKSAKGFQAVTWSVLDDDPKALAWLVGKPTSILHCGRPPCCFLESTRLTKMLSTCV